MGYDHNGLVCLDEQGDYIIIPSEQTSCIRDNLGRIVCGEISDMTTRQINKLRKSGQLRPDIELKNLLDITEEMREVAVKNLARDFVDYIKSNPPKYPGEYIRVDNGCSWKIFWTEVARLSDSVYGRILPTAWWKDHDEQFGGKNTPHLFKIENRIFKISDNFFEEVYITDDLIRLVNEYQKV